MTLKISETNKIIGGVCGGLSETLGVDATLIRILFICSVIFAGVGFIPYIVLWLLMALNK
jgi:phage shock protein PspC (stress-responsive transcriptional regulator)